MARSQAWRRRCWAGLAQLRARQTMRIWVFISGHGYGHLVQTAPILNRLRALFPSLALHVASDVPREVTARCIRDGFESGPAYADVKLIQRDALGVDLEGTRRRIRDIHRQWDREAAACRRALLDWQPDLVLSNVPYLPIAAAADCGIPSVVLSSFTWDRVLMDYFSLADLEIWGWWTHARECYAKADLAIGLAPGALSNGLFRKTVTVEPVADAIPSRKAALCALLRQPNDRPLVLVTMGGLSTPELPLAALCEERRVTWIVSGAARSAPHVIGVDSIAGWRFQDIAASVDAIVGKLGYNTAVQAAVNGVPMLYVRRTRFPDEIAIAPWLHEHHVVREIEISAFSQGNWYEDLAALWSIPRPERKPPHGADQAVEEIRALIHERNSSAIGECRDPG